jgi:hypothetical protein
MLGIRAVQVSAHLSFLGDKLHCLMLKRLEMHVGKDESVDLLPASCAGGSLVLWAAIQLRYLQYHFIKVLEGTEWCKWLGGFCLRRRLHPPIENDVSSGCNQVNSSSWRLLSMSRDVVL